MARLVVTRDVTVDGVDARLAAAGSRTSATGVPLLTYRPA